MNPSCSCTKVLSELAMSPSSRVSGPSTSTCTASAVNGTATSATAADTSTNRIPNRSTAAAGSRRAGRRVR